MELIGGVGDCLGSLSVAWWVSMALGWAGTSSMLWQDSVLSWTAFCHLQFLLSGLDIWAWRFPSKLVYLEWRFSYGFTAMTNKRDIYTKLQ